MHFLPQYLILHWVIHDRYYRKDFRQQGDGCKKRSDQKLYKLVQEVKLILMWTIDGIYTLPGMSENFQPNHFVPLYCCMTHSFLNMITLINNINLVGVDQMMYVFIVN